MNYFLTVLFLAASLVACTPEGAPNGGVQGVANTPLVVDAGLHLEPQSTYQWRVVSASSDTYSLTEADQPRPLFLATRSGSYHLEVVASSSSGAGSSTHSVLLTIVDRPQAPSPYIAKVHHYTPSAGQFINELPRYEAGNTVGDLIAKAEGYLVGKKNGGLVGLGGFGGSIVFGFDHTVVNVRGRRDIRILGNAFYSELNVSSGAPKGGSCEPGIIEVSYDANHNGQPDDPWYEIAGSEYHRPTTVKNYAITYHRPQTETPTDPMQYLPWTDNQGRSGCLAKNVFHSQSYFPLWTTEATSTFQGTLLPPNGINQGGTEQYWVLYAYGFGYVDNALNTEDDSAFDIGWAVDAAGNPVALPGVDFVKVYTAIHQTCGWLGESSTEIAGAYDLHLMDEQIATQ